MLQNNRLHKENKISKEQIKEDIKKLFLGHQRKGMKYVHALPVVQPACIHAQAVLQPMYMLPNSTIACVYLLIY
jgi:hypothetical protein